MAIGDLSTTTAATRGKTVVRVVGRFADDDGPLEVQVAEGRIFTFEVDPGRKPPAGALRRLWARLFGPPKMQRDSLTTMMNAAPDVQVTGVEEGVEWLETPFPHLVFFSALREPHVRELIETHVRETLEAEWKDYVDPLIGFRVAVAVGRDIAREEIAGFFGRGVFVPGPAERPIGKVEIVMGGVEAVDEPVLAPGLLAGLYRGQAALAMAESERVAPATSEYLPADVRFLLRGAGPSDRSASALMLTHERIGANAPSHVDVKPALTPPEGYDAAFRIEAAGGSALEIRVIEDVRPSRLWAAPPPPPFCFEIAGVVAPRERDDFKADRWWIDLDRDMNLVATALRPRFLTVLCEKGALSAFDWSRSGRKVSRPPFALRADISTNDGPALVIVKTSGVFGYLRPPQRRMEIRFEPAFGGSPSTRATYDLDWLDFAGAVETPLLVAERLGEYAGKAERGPITLPGLDGASDPMPGLLVRRSSEDAFVPGWKSDWGPGVEIIAGPLLLRIVEGRGRS